MNEKLEEVQEALDEIIERYLEDQPIGRKLDELKELFSAFQELSLAKEQALRKLLDSPELLEELASLEHQQWSMLMAHIKSVSIEERDIVEQLQSKWKEWRQLGNTPYANLTEEQKESDRMFARDMLKILKARVFDEEVSGVEEK